MIYLGLKCVENKKNEASLRLCDGSVPRTHTGLPAVCAPTVLMSVVTDDRARSPRDGSTVLAPIMHCRGT